MSELDEPFGDSSRLEEPFPSSSFRFRGILKDPRLEELGSLKHVLDNDDADDDDGESFPAGSKPGRRWKI